MVQIEPLALLRRPIHKVADDGMSGAGAVRTNLVPRSLGYLGQYESSIRTDFAKWTHARCSHGVIVILIKHPHNLPARHVQTTPHDELRLNPAMKDGEICLADAPLILQLAVFLACRRRQRHKHDARGQKVEPVDERSLSPRPEQGERILDARNRSPGYILGMHARRLEQGRHVPRTLRHDAHSVRDRHILPIHRVGGVINLDTLPSPHTVPLGTWNAIHTDSAQLPEPASFAQGGIGHDKHDCVVEASAFEVIRNES